jgi:AcrR family transcriptional regulator
MTRKIVDGKLRNKERTKKKILLAVGKLLRNKGYKSLGVNKIAETAGVDKKLIYLYFGSREKLIETYIKQTDYWLAVGDFPQQQFLEQYKTDFGEAMSIQLLQQQFEFIFQNKEMQKVLLWELSENETILRRIADNREALATQLFKLSDLFFKNSKTDMRATTAILIAGLHYLVLHATVNGSTFCELDIAVENDRKRIADAIEQIVHLSYQHAHNKEVGT